MQHETRKHARMSASRIDRVMACPGSFRLESLMPKEEAGPAAARGTAIHELSELLLAGNSLPENTDPEYAEMAQKYADFVNAYFKNPRRKMIEVNVDAALKSIHPALGGTADAILVEGNTLACLDLKTGRVEVEAKDNKQLMTYALGAMRQLNAPTSIEVDLVIFQPGVGVSVHKISGTDLIEHGHSLKAAAELALTDDAPTNPSTDACKYCKAKTICPSLRQVAQDNARADFAPTTVITPEMLDLATLAADWSDAVIATAKKYLIDGETISGWNLKPGRKMKFWTSEALAAAALKDHPNAFSLKSPAAIADLKIDVSEDLIGVKLSAPSLAKEKGKKSQD